MDFLPTNGVDSDPTVRRLRQSEWADRSVLSLSGRAPGGLGAETSSVIVAPLVRPNPSLRHPLLYPEFRIEARRLVLAISDLAALPRTRLTKRVANLDPERHRIIAALDLLFTGS
jgi:hypothetical protein